MNFVSYYVFGLPVGIVLALVADLGALGAWSGLIIGSILQVLPSGMSSVWKGT